MRDSKSNRCQPPTDSARWPTRAAAALALPLLLAFNVHAAAPPKRIVEVLDAPRGGVELQKPQTGGRAALPLEMSKDQALWTAIAFEDAALVGELLRTGADPNKPEELSRMTPLMAAETFPVASILVEKGANPNARDRTGRTPLHYAVMMRDAATIVPLLVRAGADVNARAEDAGRYTPLLGAIEKYIADKDRDQPINASVIRALVLLGADVNAADAHGTTGLAMAASRNNLKLIRLLIDLGADPARPLGNGRTPLDYAREANAHDAIQMLAALTGKAGPAN